MVIMNTLASLLCITIIASTTASGDWDSKNERVVLGNKFTPHAGVHGPSGFDQIGVHAHKPSGYGVHESQLGHKDEKFGSGLGHFDTVLGHKDEKYGHKEVVTHFGTGSGHRYGGLGQYDSAWGLKDDKYGHKEAVLTQFGSGSGHKYGGIGHHESGFDKFDGSSHGQYGGHPRPGHYY